MSATREGELHCVECGCHTFALRGIQLDPREDSPKVIAFVCLSCKRAERLKEGVADHGLYLVEWSGP